MPKYIKCPRCELNYILETEELCPVCKDEVKGVVVNDLELEEEESTRICPRCGVNYVAEDQEFCENCRAELDEINAIHDAEDEQWQSEAEGEGAVPIEELEDAEDTDELGDEALVLDEDMLAELKAEEEEDEEEDEEEVFEDDDVDDFDVNVDDYDEDEDIEDEDEDDLL